MVVLVSDAENATRRAGSPQVAGANPGDADTLRLFAEELAVTRETVETGRVRIARVTRTRDQPIDELLGRETVTVVTVPVGRQVDAIPAVRSDGDTMIIPVVEEIVVVERRLFLKEELHVRRARTSERFRDTVTLRYQEAQITRLPPQARTAGDGTAAGATSPPTQKDA
jgi:uncharacterized protein (TIGR02271 family)